MVVIRASNGGSISLVRVGSRVAHVKNGRLFRVEHLANLSHQDVRTTSDGAAQVQAVGFGRRPRFSVGAHESGSARDAYPCVTPLLKIGYVVYGAGIATGRAGYDAHATQRAIAV